MAKKLANDLPHNDYAEQAVIGSAFLSQDALMDVLSLLNEDDFFNNSNKIIYRVLSYLNEKNKKVDVLTVTEELENLKEIDNIGGVEYIRKCTDSMVALSSLKSYIDIVQDQAVLRNMILTIRDIDRSYKTKEIENISDFVTSSKEAFEKVLAKRRISNFQTTEQVVKVVKNKIEMMSDFDNREGIIGLTTGYDRLNYLTQGFKDGELIIVAARPSVGKTALCMNFAYKAATLGKKAVGIFSLEMSAEHLCQRLLGIASCVSLKHISNGHIAANERLKLSRAEDELSQAKIYIDDTPGSKLTDIMTKARKLQAQEPNLGLLIVDYLGLVTTSQNTRTPDSRQEEVRKISLAFKQLARDLHVPVILVSQLSRKVEERDVKKPMMSDLRDSGNIEQDADIIMLLYRQDYYERKESGAKFKKGGQLTNQDKLDLVLSKKEKELGESIPNNASYVEVNIAKNRNGETGKTGLFFYRDFGRFDEPSPEWLKEMEAITKEMGDD